MLNLRREDPRSDAVVARTLSHNSATYSLALGCRTCPEFEQCGGLCVEASLFDCLDLCCGNPASCNKVCPNAAERYVAYKRETLGFGLSNIPRAPALECQLGAEIVPLIYHGSARSKSFDTPSAALRLADIVDFRNARLRFDSPMALRDAFRIDRRTKIVLTGVDHDARVESWWKLGAERRNLIRAMTNLEIALVTTPNFSVVLDNPRTADLHSMKRIAITFSEFQEAGISCALHPNGRTDRDFERWAEFVQERSEVSMLAYEFITGSANKDRIDSHIKGLSLISKAAGRDLSIIVRGNPQVIPLLRRSFERVIYIDTTAFIKAHKRYSPIRSGNRILEWIPTPTPAGMSIDKMLSSNFEEQSAYLRSAFYMDAKPMES